MKDETGLARARANADRQRALNAQALNQLIVEARTLLAAGVDPSDVWAILGARLVKELECYTTYQQFAVEMLVAAVLRIAKKDNRDSKAL